MDKNIFLDTNILIDIFQKRGNAYLYADKLLKNRKYRNVYISALTIPNFQYICEVKDTGILKKFFAPFNIVDLSSDIISAAYKLKISDFEDSIQLFSCLKSNSIFITRDKKIYREFKIYTETYTPEEYLEIS